MRELPATTRKAFKEKLNPTPVQEQALERWLMLCRHVYNAALQERREAWERRKRFRCTEACESCREKFPLPSRYDQQMELPEIKRVMPEYAEVNSQVLQNAVARVDLAFQAFFRRVKAGQTPGYPRFHGQGRYNSFTFPIFGNGVHVYDGFLVITNIGRIAVRWSRPLEGTIKTITVSREADGWYVCFSCADVPVKPLPLTGRQIGIDMGIESFARDSDDNPIFNPGWYRAAERNLKRLQRCVSRRKKGSNRRRKAVKQLAKAHQTVVRQRRDFHHKEALKLVRENDVIYHEDLQTANMVRRPTPKPDGNGGYSHNGANRKAGLNKSISDAGWSNFLTTLAFKAACAGKRVISVPPAYTSQVCSGCGVIVAKGLSVRWHSCPECGTSLHRDHNAARNILQRGQELSGLRQSPQALT